MHGDSEERCIPEPEYIGTIWEETAMADKHRRKAAATPQEKALAAWYALGNLQDLVADRNMVTEFMNQQRKVRLLLLGKQFERKSKETRLADMCVWFAEMLGEALGDPDVTEKTKSFLAAQVAFSVRFSDVADRYQPQPDDPDYIE
jgi:hypothetical protein